MADRRTPQNQIDHDLLVVLHEQVRALREVDIPSLRDGLKTRLDDHEARLRSMEYKLWIWTGAAGIVGAVVSFIANHFF